MLDFNPASGESARLEALLDLALARERDAQPARDYLGGSRVGSACERALQFEFAQAPVDPGRETPGRVLRIFERGHAMEAHMVRWLRAAGFELRTHDVDGRQFGYRDANGRFRGHADGVIVAAPDGYRTPALWECKCLGSKAWRELRKHGLATAKPVYAAQVALYQAYLQLHEHPAVFTALNADTMEIHVELVPFDPALAQAMADRALRVITATDAGELLPRAFLDPNHYECKFCSWQQRCQRLTQ